jgi:hypothetical protein
MARLHIQYVAGDSSIADTIVGSTIRFILKKSDKFHRLVDSKVNM